ncbi:uncharacterized protein LOC134811870 isoform X2 [Bolinopsis microptera]|uniref:uncharacterized protein LOC134811870 isoform X2 n=1 Tax=Bolinopsis microptera TaxID=2820187 RepID=UPI00307AF227
MGAACSVSPAETRVETVYIKPQENPKQGAQTGNGTTRPPRVQTTTHQDPISVEGEGLKTDSGFQNGPNTTTQIPNSVPEIHLEDYNMDDNDNVAVSDVGSDDLVDPSLNIDDTEKKIERSRRTSKMENKAVTKQKLLRRMASQETVTKEQGHSTDTTAQTWTTL